MTTSTNLPALLETLPTVKSQAELNNALTKLKEHFNVLVPAQMNFSSPILKVALEAVQLDATVDGNGNGIDIFKPAGSSKFTLHYKAANKIAGAAGISWTSAEVAKREIDETGRAKYVEFIVGWEIKKINGSIKKGVTTGHYRHEEDKQKLEPKQVEARRRFAEALAESNAKLRAIFEALEMLPRAFTIDEIKKPFLVPCVVEDINELAKDDPEIRKMIVANALGITDKIYGSESQSKQDSNIGHLGSAEVVDEQPARPTAPTAEDIEKQNIEIWKGYTPEQRFKELCSLANKLGTPIVFEQKTYTDAPVQRQINGLLDYWKRVQAKPENVQPSSPALPEKW